jgi:cytoskeletal protein RodZ
VIDEEARLVAQKLAIELAEHRAASEVQLNSLKTSVTEIKSMLTWIGGVIISLIIGVLGWSLVQQFAANEAQKTALQLQITQLQSRAVPPPTAP